ncbi:MAG: hypothetical protein GY754_38130 [bacterium]|nr:hypothetical protein [bacterium]
MEQAFMDYLQDNSLEKFMTLRESVASSDSYSPYVDYQEKLFGFLENEQYEDANEYLTSLMFCLFLNPNVHRLAAFIHDRLGDENASQDELFIGMTLLKGILLTGDGSEKKPFLVLYTYDEYDILEHFEKEFEEQTLNRVGDKVYDLVKCKDGTELWFDITIPHVKLTEMLKPDESALQE